MALLWEKQTADTRYEVRNAGKAVRLYTNGVFHSQYNPNQPVTGNIWDLLMLPAFFYRPDQIKHVLLLGVGGGAVIQQLLHFIKPVSITGVELDPVHLYVAQRFFKVKHANVELVQADAVQWLSEYAGPPFDMIIDDLCGGESGEPVRAVPATGKWVKLLASHLSAKGVLVSNFITRQELNSSAYLQDKNLRKTFPSGYLLNMPGFENTIVSVLRKHTDSRQLRETLADIPALNTRLKTCRLKYHIRQL
ncbi:MAG: hypothetical protein OEZ39_07310 [Gammaproteobacteria bacterium]|nr:hypothetical protein [Gammaproteobacteria bacterium]MDH5651666.1 hypothetical protein [Gammaproteobacteria bacterium]